MTTATDFADLDTPYPISNAQRAQFEEQGFIKLKNVLSPETLRHFGARISAMVQQLNTQDKPMAERDTYGKAFLQVMNLWEQDETCKRFVLSKRLGQIAADLLGVSGVKLYHDQALYKEPGGGITPWHADQYYWPLATDRTITAWIPLQPTPLDLGPLAFCAKSQHKDFGRGLPITDESEKQIEQNVKDSGFAVDETPFDLGEISFHFGWTFHRAGANRSERPRDVMTMIYMDENMRLQAPTNANQQNDWNDWCPGAKVGEVIATPKNPLVFSHAR
ncbi:MAG: phytanoyl-CoA dioxygenase family protein [Opitutales bacterium]